MSTKTLRGLIGIGAAFAAMVVGHGTARAQQSSAAPAQQSGNITPKKFNVLFLISDDLRTETGNYGGLALTPNIDKLAKSSLQFDRAYCNYPLCNPSRSSLLTGRYPTSTGVVGNATAFRNLHPDWVSLPQFFKENGYASLRSGKVFHGGIDDPKAWTEGGDVPGQRVAGDEDAGIDLSSAGAKPSNTYVPRTLTPEVIAAHRPGPDDNRTMTQARRSDRWLVLDGDGEGSAENRVADRAIDYIKRYHDKQFFIACGFSKPHSPPTAPAKYYDLYDLEKIPLPPDYSPKIIAPLDFGFPLGSIRPRNADLFIGRDSTPQTAKEMIRAYLASVSWVDWNVGRVLEELDRQNLRDNTIILFWGDHGYQLGEKGKWSKAGSVWEQGARVPFTIYVPNGPSNRKTTRKLVQMVDVYPTLVELCGFPKQPELEGRSMLPVLNDSNAPAWNFPAYTIWCEDGRTVTANSVRNDKYRYAEFTAGGGGAMLLDEEADPHEMKNVVNDPKYADVKKEMHELLKAYPGKPLNP
jgi:arylsulfatase A-like enzyme